MIPDGDGNKVVKIQGIREYECPTILVKAKKEYACMMEVIDAENEASMTQRTGESKEIGGDIGDGEGSGSGVQFWVVLYQYQTSGPNLQSQ